MFSHTHNITSCHFDNGLYNKGDLVMAKSISQIAHPILNEKEIQNRFQCFLDIFEMHSRHGVT